MARKKIRIEEKKPKIGITIDNKLNDILEEYLAEIGINKSKYIENLIRKDFEKNGKNIAPDV